MIFGHTAQTLLLGLLAAASPAAAPADTTRPDDPMGRERMEKLLADGDDAIVMAVLRRRLDDALPFVDQYMEGGLKLLESGGSREDALKSFRMGIKFAQLADQAAPGAGFAEYATNFASWTSTEHKRFRDGQAAYKAGRALAKDDPAQAMERFRKSLSLANSLGDTWGAAMAYAGMAKAELEQGHVDKVGELCRRANEINQKLRQRVALIRVVLIWGDSESDNESRGYGNNIYSYAWTQLQDDDPPPLRLEVMSKYVQSLERVGQPAMAQEIRNRFASPGVGAGNAPPVPAQQQPAKPVAPPSGKPPDQNPAQSPAPSNPGGAGNG